MLKRCFIAYKTTKTIKYCVINYELRVMNDGLGKKWVVSGQEVRSFQLVGAIF